MPGATTNPPIRYLDLNVSAVISYRHLLDFFSLFFVMSPSKTYRSIAAYFGLAASFFSVRLHPFKKGNISGANHNFVKTRANHGKKVV